MRLLIFNLRMDADDGVLGFTTDWVNALAARCEHVFVITMDAGAIRVAPNVEVVSVGKERGYGRARILLNLYRETWKVLRHGRVDGCFAHMNYVFALWASPLLKLFRTPIMIWYAHGSVPPLLRPATFMADRMVASSASGFRLKTEKLRIIGQGIDTERFAPRPEGVRDGPFRVLTLGRISRIKRIEVVIDAIARLRDQAPAVDIRCDLVGDPLDEDGRAYRSELEARIVERRLEGRVRLLPGVPFHSAHEVFAGADLFVNSGDTDSVDKTVLEALSCGTPVITSNKAFEELFPPALKPLSLIPKNDVEALANAILAVHQLSPADRIAHASLGRRLVVEHHSLSGLVDKLMNEMRALIAARSPGRLDIARAPR